MTLRRSLVAAAALALAGCSLDGFGQPEARTGQTSPPPRTEAPAAQQPAAATRPRADLQALLNADEARVDGYLGRPQMVRSEGAGEMRMYRSNACVVHVFLFPRAGRLTAAHVEARAGNRRLSPDQADTCIASFS